MLGTVLLSGCSILHTRILFLIRRFARLAPFFPSPLGSIFLTWRQRSTNMTAFEGNKMDCRIIYIVQGICTLYEYWGFCSQDTVTEARLQSIYCVLLQVLVPRNRLWPARERHLYMPRTRIRSLYYVGLYIPCRALRSERLPHRLVLVRSILCTG